MQSAGAIHLNYVILRTLLSLLLAILHQHFTAEMGKKLLTKKKK